MAILNTDSEKTTPERARLRRNPSKIRFDDFTELIPAFAVVALISFTYNIGIGVTAGFVLYPFCKLISGRQREVKKGLWVLAILSLLFFVFYPYR